MIENVLTGFKRNFLLIIDKYISKQNAKIVTNNEN